ncbi:hypothetical protein ACFGVR_08065 [Mucilaginibacter sp. AW1-3]
MKNDKIIERIKFHKESKKYVKIIRQIPGGGTEKSAGYILQYSEDFILLHETDDFRALGYIILPIWQICELRMNRADKYYDKIMRWEKITDEIGIDFVVDLKSWQSVFKQLQKKDLTVIVECETPEIDTFTIGPITNVGSKYVYIQYFDAEGYFDKESTSVDYASITQVQFNDHYSNIISKYIRHRKELEPLPN